MKEIMDKYLDYFGEKILPFLLVFAVLFYICYLVFGEVYEIFSNDKEQVVFSTHSIRIIEAKYPIGSIFNKDELEITNNSIIYHRHRGLENENISISFGKIDKIIFTDGVIWNSIAIENTDFLFNKYVIYVRDDSSTDLIRAAIDIPDVTVVDKTSFFKSIQELDLFKTISSLALD